MDAKVFLEKLTSMTGVSGHEDEISGVVSLAFEEYCEDVRRDSFFNVFGRMPGTQKEHAIRIMISAHMDEIGMMVVEIDDKGFIKFTNIGGIDQRVLLAQEITVHGKENLYGVIGAKPPHLQQPGEAGKAVLMSDMAIDVGLPVDRVKELVHIGDLISYNSPLLSLQGDMVTSKALDDRAGVALLLDCMRELKNFKHHADVYFVASVQEEVGLRGATISAFACEPDIGIAIDVTHGDTPDASREETFPMDKGPAIAVGPNIHPGLHKRLMQTAQDYGIPYIVDVCDGVTGTDAGALQISRQGIPTLLLEMPLRYMHTTVETLNLSNVKMAAKLLALFIVNLGTDLEELICY